jgi:hypothetical protein
MATEGLLTEEGALAESAYEMIIVIVLNNYMTVYASFA